MLSILKFVFGKLLKKSPAMAYGQEYPYEESGSGILGWLLDLKNLKTVGLCLLGGFGLIALVRHLWQKYTYRSALAVEMKKQLEPVYEKLESIEEQNEQLKRQNDELLERMEERA